MRYLTLGLVLAGAALLALALLEPFGGSDGAGGNVCDRPLPALGSGKVSQEQFDAADTGLDRTVRLADEGDADGAYLVFVTEVHDFTHDVDGPLRESNDGLAKGLCNAVAQIEAEFAFRGEVATITEQAAGIRDLLRQAAAELGFALGRQ